MRVYSFGAALEVLKDGGKVARSGWNAPGQSVKALFPDGINDEIDVPYCVLTNAQGKRVPWVPSQGDLFADDWMIVQ